MLALVLQMNTAREINFLDTPVFHDGIDQSWSISQWLRATPLFKRFAHTEPDPSALLAVDGGFVFEQELALSIPSGVISGVVGMSLFMLAGGVIASESLSTAILSRATEIAETSNTALMLGELNSTTARVAISPKENQVSIKKSPPTSKSTSTVGTAVVESVPTPVVKQPALQREVFGFLPYWFVNEAADNLDFSLLSTLAYFDVPMNADGSLDTLSNSWKILHSGTAQDIFTRAKASNTRVVLTYATFNNQHIENISTNEQARNNAVTNMVNFAKSQGAQGANIDFEYVGEPDASVREGFTVFVQQATERFHAEIPGSQVTVSMYAVSAKMERLYQVDRLADASDGLFIMAYDFYTAGSSNAGPVAPLTGAPGSYWYDVTSSVNDFTAAGVPESKMILGVPYYGYDWPTADHSPKSTVLPGSTNTANYSGVQKVLAAGEGERRWDEAAQVPYLVYQENGVNRIAYYDDTESLGKKYDLVNERNLKGAGIWALGQDGDHKELWDLLRTKFVHE